MRNRHRWGAAGAVVVAAVASVTSASAHSTLDKKSVPADTDVALAVNAPVEELNAYNQKIVLEIPPGFRVLRCEKTRDFDCAVTPPDAGGRSLITWNRPSAGQPVPFVTDMFPFSVHTVATPGKYVFEINQFYSNGTAAHWDGAEDSDHPAAVLQVTGKGTPAVTNTTAAPHDGSPATPSPSALRTTSSTTSPAPTTTTTVTPDTLAADTTTSDPRRPSIAVDVTKGGGTSPAGPIALVAGIVGATAVGVAVLRRRRPARGS